MKKRHWLTLVMGSICSLALQVQAAPPAEGQRCAAVVLHGKWGNLQYMRFFTRRLDPPCDYKMLEMPWSQRRAYDAPYSQAIADIAAQVRKFREEGFSRVLLIGHSFGGNAALAYMTQVADVDGVIVLAPGHSPRRSYENGVSRAGVDQARALVAEGKGSETVSIEDVRTGQTKTMRMRADVAESYFAPDGLADIGTSVTRWKRAVPVLWAIGQQDIPSLRQPREVLFDKLPQHPESLFISVPGDHVGMMSAAGDQVLEWIKRFP